jgi:multidrug transporter EmrE-like cation transporter
MFLRAPAGWSPFVVAAVAMVLLAGLDLAGAYAAKEAVARRSPAYAAAGIALFVLLFWVYSSSLQYAELGPVTLGWIVVLQVGVVLLDRFHYGQPVPRGHWAAIVLIIAAQAYLLLAPTGAPPTTADPPAARVLVSDARHRA